MEAVYHQCKRQPPLRGSGLGWRQQVGNIETPIGLLHECHLGPHDLHYLDFQAFLEQGLEIVHQTEFGNLSYHRALLVS